MQLAGYSVIIDRWPLADLETGPGNDPIKKSTKTINGAQDHPLNEHRPAIAIAQWLRQ